MGKKGGRGGGGGGQKQQQQQQPKVAGGSEEETTNGVEEEPPIVESPTTKGKGNSKNDSSSAAPQEHPPMNIFFRYKVGASLRQYVQPPSISKKAPAQGFGKKAQAPLAAAAPVEPEESTLPGAMNTLTEIDTKADMRDCQPTFSADGSTVVYASTEEVTVSRTCNPASDDPTAAIDAPALVLQKIPESKITEVQLSPKGTYLVTYRQHDAHSEATKGNMSIWQLEADEDDEQDEDEEGEERKDLKKLSGGGREVLRAVQAVWPCVEWSADEKFAVRQLQQRLMVHDGKFSTTEPFSKVDLSYPRGKEACFAVSPSEATPFCAIFRPQTKVPGQATCQVFRLPQLSVDPLLAHSFGKGDSAKLLWNPSGSALTCVVNSATDASHASYYGVTTLAILHVKDKRSVNIKLAEKEAIHDCRWSPVADELIVVHGIMPNNKATLYNGKGEAVYSFGEAPRNLIKWAPNGKFFVMGGSGGMNGDFQFYCREHVGKRGPLAAATGGPDGKMGFFSEKSTTQMWSPCSRYLLCSNVFRLLRTANRFTVWKHNGERLLEEKFTDSELHGIDWVPTPAKNFRPRAASPTKVSATQAAAKPTAYRPPGGGSRVVDSMLNRPTSASYGGAAKPKAAGPVGGAVLETKKKKK